MVLSSRLLGMRRLGLEYFLIGVSFEVSVLCLNDTLPYQTAAEKVSESYILYVLSM